MEVAPGYPPTPGDVPMVDGGGPDVDPLRFFFPLPFEVVVLAGGIELTPFMVGFCIIAPGGIPDGIPGGTPGGGREILKRWES